MDRRSLLTGVGAVVAGGLTGCVADGAGDDADASNGTATGDERTPGNETTAGGDGTRTAPPAETTVTDSSLTVVDAGCGQRTDTAAVSFEADATTVVVTGTVWGSDACKIPVLADASYDAPADELSVTVATRNRDTDGTTACGQCITELDYEVTVAFEGGLPGSVTVRHDHGDDGGVVATATPS